MRSWIVAAAIVPLFLAACGARDEDEETPAAANYSPPTVTSRLDFGSEIERRFHDNDVNRDDKITPDELPERLRPMIARGDKNGDGALSAEEWGDLLLDWFDRNDLNKDRTLTSEERETYRAQQRARRAAAAPDGSAR
ncbi:MULTISPECIES: hypothetical protein [unclassified Sphingomonas]|jgi:hypothetical protein|uniref:hypothetical protein n=1 Tax=unclassified Sphingomonas TaxID=196159 RepID=UPI000621646D|nr:MULTISPECIES: hypothetical protein [unclassified Sphingomonas]KKI18792.1 hypothetical protein XM50_10830 [Sphingomonas sp. Ag1]MDF2605021.1 hypothetical protein [Sphingomonas sp.]